MSTDPLTERLSPRYPCGQIIAIAICFVVFRTWLATKSGFGFHQGWNEGHYALIARGFRNHVLTPRYGTHYVYNVPPLFPYVIAVFFSILGESAFTSRLPSIFAAGGTIVATYWLGLTVYRDRLVASVGAVLLTLLPYFQLYSGRAQTDVMMVLFFTTSLTCIIRGYRGKTWWLIPGGLSFAAAFATKQPAILLPAIVLAWLVSERHLDRELIEKTGVLVVSSIVGLVPLFLWFYLNYRLAPSAFIGAWEHELLGRTVPFANIPLLLAIGFGLGITPAVIGLVGVQFVEKLRKFRDSLSTRGRRSTACSANVIWFWLLLYGGFVLYRTPHGHQYYAVALTPPVSLIAARGFVSLLSRFERMERPRLARALLALVVLSSIGGTVVLFDLSGEYSIANNGGERVAADTGEYLAREVPDNATVLVPNGYSPPIKWYTRSEFPIERIHTYRVSRVNDEWLRNVSRRSSGPVYLVYPQPSWGPEIDSSPELMYRSTAYEFTFSRRLPVDSNSKFRFYLEQRRLLVYQIE